MTAVTDLPDNDAVHTWFELTYSNYLVLPRTLMQSMPAEWQRRMVACLEELDEAFEHVEQAPGYNVVACRWESPDVVPDDVLRQLGFNVEHGPDGSRYETPDGQEVEGRHQCVPLPVVDPIPHYDRGRARVEPYERVDVPVNQTEATR